jgi:hypothetical protein
MLVRGIRRRVLSRKITARLRACFQQMNSLVSTGFGASKWQDLDLSNRTFPTSGRRSRSAACRERQAAPFGCCIRSWTVEPYQPTRERRHARTGPARRSVAPLDRPALPWPLRERSIHRPRGRRPGTSTDGDHYGPGANRPKMANGASGPLAELSEPCPHSRYGGRLQQCRRSVGAEPRREFVGVIEHDLRTGVPHVEPYRMAVRGH